MISKPNESGELRISSSGKVYYWQYYNLYNHQFDNDTIEIRDIRNNEVIIKTSPIIPSLESDSNIDTKAYHRLELFNNDTKLLCYLVYVDKDDNRNSKNNFVIYNIQTKEIEYMSQPFSEDYLALSKSYLSPDDKYMIEVSAVKSKARIFDLETKKFEFEFDGENNDEESYKIGALQNGSFQFNNHINIGSGSEYILFSFPLLNIEKRINFFSKYGLFLTQPGRNSICNNSTILRISERYPNQSTKYYRYFINFDFNTEEFLFSSKEYQLNLDYCEIFLIENCTKLIIDRDYDYRPGIIACYDYNTLNIETKNTSSGYFSKSDSSINFNSQVFIGETANIDIYNSTGVKVGILYNGILNQPNYNFNIPELPSGAYYLQCQLPNQNLNFNFVVVR